MKHAEESSIEIGRKRRTHREAKLRVLRADLVEDVIAMQEAIQLMRDWLLGVKDERAAAPPRQVVTTGSGNLTFTVGGTVADPVGAHGFRVYHSNTRSNDPRSEFTAVFEPYTGRLKGIVVGAELAEWRTGALGGVAVHALAPPDARTLCVVGTGRQARTQALAALSTRPFRECRVYSRDPRRRDAFCQMLSARHDCRVVNCDNIYKAGRGAEVIILATSSNVPILPADAVERPCHVNLIGPKYGGACEIDPRLLDEADLLVTDSLVQAVARSADSTIFSLGHGRRLRSLSGFIERSPCGVELSVFVSCGISGTEVVLADALLRATHHNRCIPNE